jgi:F-type H+-transporting ATPase subunit b
VGVEAAAEKTRLIAAAIAEANQERQRQLKALNDELTKSEDDFIRGARHEILALVRKILGDLASADLESAAVEVFLRRLAERPVQPDAPAESAATASAPRVCSAFNLGDDQRQRVEAATRLQFATTRPLEFHTEPALGFGIELTVRDQRLSWTLDDYLASFKARFAELTPQFPAGGTAP